MKPRHKRSKEEGRHVMQPQPKCARPVGAVALSLLLVALIAAVFSGCKKKAASVTPLPGQKAYVGSGSPESLSIGKSSSTGRRYMFPTGSVSGGGGAGKLAEPGSQPSPGEELWIIARSGESAAEAGESEPGCGAMLATNPEGEEVPMPLNHTDVRAEVLGSIATVKVTQQFHNPFDAKIEAKYVFPLPQNAAVNEFIMTIGDRRIRGIIRERQEAERIYEAARSQGYVASLLTQERPNIFTQSIANIEPGKQIDVELTYFNTLAWADGWYEFVFPTVVGPRFNPPGSTEGIGAVGRGRHGVSGQSAEVQYLKPHERSGQDIAITLNIDAGVKIEKTECITHVVSANSPAAGKLDVTLSPNDRIPNKDFVFRYKVAGDQIKSGLVTSQDERGGFFSLMIYPPQDLEKLSRKPLEMVFVLDSSGSMNGRPISEAKKAMERALRQLQPEDSFQLINFSSRASQLGSKPLPATPENVNRGLAYINRLEGQGGTMMIEGIKAALDFPHDPRRLRFVCFLTDGYIGNEAEILAVIEKRLGSTRIFSFGIGTSVNRYLMERMAKVGRGAVAYLGPNDSAVRIMDEFIERISHPALTDVELDWGKLKVTDVYPRTVPDLFVGRPVILTGRFTGNSSSAVRVAGKAGEDAIEWAVSASRAGGEEGSGLPSVWARMKIADLSDLALTDHSGELEEEIKQVALDYGLLSGYTAFVAVDSSRVTEGEEGTTAPVAVPVPDGVKYKTTVPEE